MKSDGHPKKMFKHLVAYEIFETLCRDIKLGCLLKPFTGGWQILNKVDTYLKRATDIVYEIRYQWEMKMKWNNESVIDRDEKVTV